MDEGGGIRCGAGLHWELSSSTCHRVACVHIKGPKWRMRVICSSSITRHHDIDTFYRFFPFPFSPVDAMNLFLRSFGFS